MIIEGTTLEISYARDTMPRGVLGMNANMMEEYLQFIANRRLAQIGLTEQYPGAKNPFPWMSEIMDLKKEKNFFETRVTDYQTGGALTWDKIARPSTVSEAQKALSSEGFFLTSSRVICSFMQPLALGNYGSGKI